MHSIKTIVGLVMVAALLIPKTRCQSSTESSRAKFTITEEQPTGSVVGEIKALSWYTSNQHLQHANLSFTLVSLDGSSDAKLFAVDSLTGVIRTTTIVDRDSICRRAVTCVVDFNVGVQHSKDFELLKITVEVLDINDNSPRFPKSRIDHNISESMTPGILFPIDVAEDPDSPRNGVARYQLISSSQHFELQLSTAAEEAANDEPFFVNPPLLVLRQPLDRELQQLHQMKIVAYDAGDPPNSGSVLLDIVVTDSNDNGPRFVMDHYRAEVVENRLPGGPLVSVVAKDSDVGDNAIVTYSLSRRSIASGIASTFAVDRTSGVVTLLKPLDYEQNNIFSFEVIAFNPHPGEAPVPTATAKVTVRVIDVNDNAPQINLDAATVTGNGGGPVVSVPENSGPDTLVAHLSVTDPDTGDAGFVDCTLSAGEPGAGHDATRYFRLVRVDDQDYQLMTSSAAVLDRETTGGGMFRLTVTCRDSGTEPGPMTSSINFRVSIADVNDNAPLFSHVVYNFSLNENAQPGTTIGRVSATDADSDHGGVRYHLHDDASDFVAIDEITGQITSAVSFDHETASVLRFHVLASSLSSSTDEGTEAEAEDDGHGHGSRQTASALVIVVILNVDDESPTFVEPAYEFQIPENQPLMKSVGRVTARDADSPPFDIFRYRLDGGTDAEQFVIDPKTGVVSARQSLDREKQPVYRMTVFAESASLPVFRRGSANLTVHVTDENDNAPVVRYPAHGNGTLRVSSYSSTGHVITRISASDSDEDDQLTFELSSVSVVNSDQIGTPSKKASLFHVDRHTGDVKVARSLDSIADGTTFRLFISVLDGSSPPKSTTATLYLIVVRSDFVPEKVWQPLGAGSGSMSPSLSAEGGDNFRLVLEGKVQLGVVVGIIAFSVVLMCALLATIIVCRRRRRHLAAIGEPKDSAEMAKIETKSVNQEVERPEEDNGLVCQTTMNKDWTKLPVDVISNANTEILSEPSPSWYGENQWTLGRSPGQSRFFQYDTSPARKDPCQTLDRVTRQPPPGVYLDQGSPSPSAPASASSGTVVSARPYYTDGNAGLQYGHYNTIGNATKQLPPAYQPNYYTNIASTTAPGAGRTSGILSDGIGSTGSMRGRVRFRDSHPSPGSVGSAQRIQLEQLSGCDGEMTSIAPAPPYNVGGTTAPFQSISSMPTTASPSILLRSRCLQPDITASATLQQQQQQQQQQVPLDGSGRSPMIFNRFND